MLNHLWKGVPFHAEPQPTQQWQTNPSSPPSLTGIKMSEKCGAGPSGLSARWITVGSFDDPNFPLPTAGTPIASWFDGTRVRLGD
jgi:hypothetical protein